MGEYNRKLARAACFLKILRHFPYPVKNYDNFVRRNRKNPYINAENRDKTGKKPIM